MEYLFQEVAGERIPYLHMGRGEPLLFLHGIGGPPHVYAALLERLATRFTVIAPALYGIPSVRRHDGIVRSCDLTMRFCEALRLRPKAVIGHSYGGAVALLLPDSFPRIVAINPLLPTRHTVVGLLLRAARRSSGAMLGRQGRLIVKPAWSTAATALGMIALHPLRSYRIMRELASVSAPVSSAHILYGDHDEFFADSTARRYVGQYPNLHVLPGQRHDWPLYDPALAARELFRIL